VQQAEIGVDHPENSPQSVYVGLEDSAGKVAFVTHPDPAAATIGAWTEWAIPLSSFTGVNPAKVKKVYLGVGDRKNPVPDGAGRVYIDDIRITKGVPAQPSAPAIVGRSYGWMGGTCTALDFEGGRTWLRESSS